jgi:hypothetical protein
MLRGDLYLHKHSLISKRWQNMKIRLLQEDKKSPRGMKWLTACTRAWRTADLPREDRRRTFSKAVHVKRHKHSPTDSSILHEDLSSNSLHSTEKQRYGGSGRNGPKAYLRLIVKHLSGDAEESHETQTAPQIRKWLLTTVPIHRRQWVADNRDLCDAVAVYAAAWSPTLGRSPKMLIVFQIFTVFPHILCCICIISSVVRSRQGTEMYLLLHSAQISLQTTFWKKKRNKS